FAFRTPDSIEVEVVILPLGDDSVSLDTKGIGKEFIGPTAIMKGVYKDANAVVIEDVFAPAHVRTDRVAISLADKNCVDVLVVVGKICNGLKNRRRAIVRFALAKSTNPKPMASGFSSQILGNCWRDCHFRKLNARGGQRFRCFRLTVQRQQDGKA